MSDVMDIRTWARDQGLDVNTKGPISKAVMEQWGKREQAPEEPVAPAEIPDHAAAGDSYGAKPRTSSFRFWQKAKEAAPSPSRPKSLHRRVSIENVVSGAWGLGAYAVARNPGLLPVARCLDMQAPVAGVLLNDTLKGTIVDRALQPIARMEEKGAKVGALVAPPFLVGLICLRPDLGDAVKPFLKMSIMTFMEVSEPAMKKLQTRAKRFEDKVGISPEAIDGMIDALFAAPPGSEWAAEESPSEEMAA